MSVLKKSELTPLYSISAILSIAAAAGMTGIECSRKQLQTIVASRSVHVSAAIAFKVQY